MKKFVIGAVAALAALATLSPIASADGKRNHNGQSSHEGQDDDKGNDRKPGTATLSVLHGIPGAGGFPVDVTVKPHNGAAITVSGAKFGDLVDQVTVPKGEIDVIVKLAGTNTVALSDSLKLRRGANVTVVAYLDAQGKPAIEDFSNKTRGVEAGDMRLTVRHTAQAPAVDIYAGTGGAAPALKIISGLSNGMEKGRVILAGSYSVGLGVAPSTVSALTLFPTVALPAGKNVIVYAIGSYPATFTTKVQVVNLAG